MKTNKHLTQEERYTIERMRKEGYNQARIAECLGRDPGTISREIRRNSGHRGYRHKQAQGKAEIRRFISRRRVKPIFNTLMAKSEFSWGLTAIDFIPVALQYEDFV